jgi:cytochrome c oxidase subunit II
MFNELPLFPEQASTLAPKVDHLFFFLCAVSGFFTLLIAVLIIYFAVKYRRRSEAERPPTVEGSLKLEIFWTVVPFLITLVMFVWGARLYVEQSRPPDNALQVYVIGKQWMWKTQHLGGQREINGLTVPVGRPVKLTMTSQDVIHDFSVPAFRVKQDVLPGRYVTLWFQATKTGKFHLFCAEYCGTNHSRMVGWVTVLEPRQFEAWLRGRADGSPASEGLKLFKKLQCVACHSNDAQARAPVLEGLYGKTVTLDDGRTVVADDEYLRESILNPSAKVVAGFRPIMPTFQGQVTEEQVLQLIAYIRSLGPGQSLPRNEETPPPAAAPKGF